MLAPGPAVHHDLGKDQRADRRLVLERAGDADDHDPFERHRVEQTLDAFARELHAHPGDDRDHLATRERSRVHGDTTDFGFDQGKPLRERDQLDRHGEDEADRVRGCAHCEIMARSWSVRYRRMPIEIESPEQLGYDTITNNLSESSVADRRLG